MKSDLQRQLIRDLVVESSEALDQFEQDLLAIESGRADDETLNRIFRAIHSLKGTSGCLGLGRIERLAHSAENLLSLMREGKLAVSSDLVTTLFHCSDLLRKLLHNLENSGEEGDLDCDPFIQQLQALQISTQVHAASEPRSGLFEEDDGAEPQATTTVPARSVPPSGEGANSGSGGASEAAIRVEVDQLDTLMDLVGELVLARNQIVQFAGQSRDTALLNSTQRLNIVTTKLQESVMKTRMQPIGSVWAKYPRIVRDVSQQLGKRVNLQLEGSETELDRTILEAIKDPLTHVVRNAVDHGLETPATRMAVGKSPEGLLRLRAFHEGGQVIIEVIDDGSGVDRDRVVKKALQRGLIGAEQATRLTDREVYQLLFLPGFSTADKVTNLSGRGVGMDVVKKNIERIGGTVDIQSEPGRSTVLRLKIPLTLAIIPALIVHCGDARYAIPQASLIELVRIDQNDNCIEFVDACPVYRLRGNLLPVVSLRDTLKLTGRGSEADQSNFLLVLQAEGRQFGLVVDGINDSEEIVVKPLGKELKSLSVYAGATIMGDGRVALILDVIGMARHAKLLTDSTSSQNPAAETVDAGRAAAQANRERLLLFSLGQNRNAAIALSSVARLEEFTPQSVELAAGCQVVQYRGDIMPLVDLGRILQLGSRGADGVESLKVIVYSTGRQNVGLVVDRIVDIIESEVSLQRYANRPGVLGSAVVQKRVTDFLDVPALIASAGVPQLECRQA